MSNNETEQSKTSIPHHIAIIPDGNRRWAKEHGMPEYMGHKKGAEIFEELCNYSRSVGVECMTLWAFSTENWKRSKDEVEHLFELVRANVGKYRKKCIEEKIRFKQLGRRDRFPEDITKAIIETEELTKTYTDFTIAIAADYGGHDELIRTITKLTTENLAITPENIEKNLDTGNLPRLDLIIRPGGEFRLSGFMPWQSEYAEYYFTKKYFPDFNTDELKIAIEEFSRRDRRFGGNTAKS